MAIQGGFKMTEVGMIPNDWEVKTLGSLTDKCSYGVGAEARVYCGGVKYIRITDIDDESHRFSPSPITSPSFYQEKHIVQKNDLLVARTGASVGKSYLYDKNDGTLIYAGFLMKLNVFNADSKYVFYNTLTKSYWNWVASESARTGQPGLNLQQMKLYSIPLPPTIKEQQRIANALSDVDTLIANLEKLIAKKKNIKQGAMQQLLTGKKRLPGFGLDERTGSSPTDEKRKACHSERSAKREVEESSGYKMTELGMIPSDWEVKPIKELGLFLGGGTPSTKNESFWKGNIPWISSADLNDDDIEHISMTRFITQEAVNFSATQICPQGTILIITRVGVGKLALSQQKVCTSQDFCNLIPSKENDSKFLAYALLPVMKRMSNESQGTSIKGVAVDEIKKVQIIVPSSKAEQTAIANVLSDMDAEIATLETKLAKYRKLKTGMMQQLLTGKIRLVDAKPETKSVENNRVVPIAFKRAVLAAEIAHRLCAEPTFGHVKMEKMLFLAEKMCELDINSSYHRDAAGPYDNRALHSVDSQLEKQKWFKFIRSDKGNHYIPLEKRGGHSQYFERYYSECRSVFDSIISTFKTAKTEQCEIVATLYSAWEDFLNQGANPTDDQIVTEVLTNWNESKKRISKERWIKALSWMKENSFVPRRT